MATQLPRLLTTDDVSEYLGVPIRTLEGWRSGKTPQGPPFVHVGTRVRYPENLLAEWVDSLTKGGEQR